MRISLAVVRSQVNFACTRERIYFSKILHVLLLRVVESCCPEFEAGQTFCCPTILAVVASVCKQLQMKILTWHSRLAQKNFKKNLWDQGIQQPTFKRLKLHHLILPNYFHLLTLHYILCKLCQNLIAIKSSSQNAMINIMANPRTKPKFCNKNVATGSA